MQSVTDTPPLRMPHAAFAQMQSVARTGSHRRTGPTASHAASAVLQLPSAASSLSAAREREQRGASERAPCGVQAGEDARSNAFPAREIKCFSGARDQMLFRRAPQPPQPPTLRTPEPNTRNR
eukprot:3426798-Rhodomonas_salina.1